MAESIRGDTKKLTPKQEKFVQGLISGKSQRESYIYAGYKYNKERLDVVDIKASELFKNGKVTVRYNELRGKVIEKAEKKCLFSFERLIEEWEECLADSKVDRNYAGRTKALTELTTLFNYYPKEDAEVSQETKLELLMKKVDDKL